VTASERLQGVKTLPQLIAYLRDELEWPIEAQEVEDLTYEYEPEELGLDEHHAARVKEIKQLRPLESGQPWGIFWVNFEKKRLPLVVLRRILGNLILKRRAGARKADRPGWHLNDLLFISSYGEEEHRTVSFAHFTEEEGDGGLPALRVMGWDDLDTGLHIDHVADRLHNYLRWQGAREDKAAWRERWASAFTTRHLEVIRTSRDLSIRLAELAKSIRRRILEVLEVESEKGPLTKLMKAFKESLVHDLDADTFADMYAQTIAYGLLSARIADPKSRTADDLGAHLRTNPFLKELMATFLQAGGRRGRAGAPNIDFDELGVGEVVRLLDAADMEAVVRDFGDRNPQEDPVIHFYELFLKQYDAKKRMQRGVFYTPRPVVSYIVRSVDELLRTEFGLPDGLADTTTWGEMAKKVDAASCRVNEATDAASKVDAASCRVNEVDAASYRVNEVDAASSRVDSNKRQDAASTFHYFDPDEPIEDLSGNLPHWRQEGVMYFVTFRLADSLPKEKLRQWLDDRDTWLKTHPEPLSQEDRRQYYDQFPARLQYWLDQGHGSCVLARPGVKAVVEKALRCFDGQRYGLDEFVVMPNHVHALVTPMGEHTLSQILHSWKSFTANEINKMLKKKGELWQKESFDHIVRSPESLERIRQYIRNNPRNGGGGGGGIVDAASCRAEIVDAASSRVEKVAVDAASSRIDSKKRQDASSTADSTFNIPEGVSPDQPFVQILDPACGTGTFLVEAIDLIHKTLKEKWKVDAASSRVNSNKSQDGSSTFEDYWNEYVPKHLLPRLHGYELLMAPYAIAHLKVGLKLKETGYRFESGERARIYLTNALEPPVDTIQRMDLLIAALAHEAQAVNQVKRDQRFTVVIGNPPYSLLSANLEAQHRALVDAYKFVNGVQIQERGALQLEKNLNDDYVKFTRFAQLSVERTGFGVTGLITNHSFLDNPTMRGVRWSLLQSASRIWLNDLHGNATKQEQPPKGEEDVNVFQIKQGVAIALSVRLPRKEGQCEARHHERWGFRESKDVWLAANHVGSHEWLLMDPTPDHFLFVPQSTSLKSEFTAWPSLADIMPANGAGYITARDNLVIDFDRNALIERIRAFNASRKDDAALLKAFNVAAKKGWDAQRARAELKHVDIAERVIKTNYRPFDSRWIFFDSTLVWGRSWPTMKHVVGHPSNLTMLATRMTKDQWDVWVAITVSSHKAMSAYDTNSVFPLYLTNDSESLQKSLGSKQRINFTTPFLRLLASTLDLQQKGEHSLPADLTPEDIFRYAYAVFHSPDYRSRYAEFLKIDFPRLPLTGNMELFRALGRLGGDLVALHLLESSRLVRHITEYLGDRAPEVEKVSWSKNTVWLDKAQTTGFKGVREEMWNFHIGGYQVCEKWLKDRKGRKLSAEDIAHYQKIVVAISETIRLMQEIDEVIEKHGGWPGAFVAGKPQAEAVAIETPPEAPLPFRKLSDKEAKPYKNGVPLYSLKAAAGKFSEAQEVEPEAWVEFKTSHKLREGMFVAQVVGKSMEPAIPDGSYCLFTSPVQGTRQGKILLVQHHAIHDPDTGGTYTVKKYTSEKNTAKDGTWHHESITLKPLNPDYDSMTIGREEAEDLKVIAEWLEILS